MIELWQSRRPSRWFSTLRPENVKIRRRKRGILVASAGNHGDMNIHVKSTIPVSQTRYLFFDFRNNKPLKEEDRKKKMLIFDLWTQSTDGIDRLEVKPFLLINNKIDFMDEPFWKKYGWFEDNQSQETKKIETKIWMRLPLIRHEKNDSTILFGLKLTNIAKDKEEIIHGWLSQEATYVKKSIPKIPI